MTTKDQIIQILSPKIEKYLNYSVNDLKKILGIKSTAKSINSLIISKIIDLKELDLDTTLFLKKYTIFKTVNLGLNNRLVESMSFPSIDYYDMVKNDWLNSSVYKYFSTKTIVIFIFKKTDDDSKFIGVNYLKLGVDDLQEVFLVWEKVKNMINNDTVVIGGKNGFSVENFPKKEDNSVTHIRPHDRTSSEGRVLLPNGRRIINYCFWLNNSFIEKKISEGDYNEIEYRSI
jgi:hypothetical protein